MDGNHCQSPTKLRHTYLDYFMKNTKNLILNDNEKDDGLYTAIEQILDTLDALKDSHKVSFEHLETEAPKKRE